MSEKLFDAEVAEEDAEHAVRAAALAIGVLGASGLYTLAAAARLALW